MMRNSTHEHVVALTQLLVGKRRVMSLIHRWQEDVVVVAQPGKYEELVQDIEDALDQAEVPVDRKPAPVVLALPAKILGRIAGTGLADLVPDRLWRLVRKDLDVLVHPSDILVSGTKEEVARARAAIAIRLAWSSAYLTTEPDAQKVEDLMTQARASSGGTLAALLREIDRRLERPVIPYEEWETLYRMRLQLVAEDVNAAPDIAGQGDESAIPAQVLDKRNAPPAGRRPPQEAGPVSWAGAGVLMVLLAIDVVLSIAGMRSRKGVARR